MRNISFMKKNGKIWIIEKIMPQLRFSSLFFLCACYCVLAQSTEENRFPNFKFPDGKSLQDHTLKGVVLVYGDSSCPACQRAQGHLKIRQKRWKEWGFPIVYIALDSDQNNLKKSFGTTPWAQYCDEKSWDSPWITSANIEATPTLLALDRNLLLRYTAKNVAQMELWLLTRHDQPNWCSRKIKKHLSVFPPIFERCGFNIGGFLRPNNFLLY